MLEGQRRLLASLAHRGQSCRGDQNLCLCGHGQITTMGKALYILKTARWPAQATIEDLTLWEEWIALVHC